MDESSVEGLLGECRGIAEEIAGHRAAVAGLIARRDGLVRELRLLGLSERAVGRLVGISGVRVHQIGAVSVGATPDDVVWAVSQSPEEPRPEFVERGIEREFAGAGVAVSVVPQAPVKRSRKPPVSVPVQLESAARPGGLHPCCKHCKRGHAGHVDPCVQGCR